MSTIPHRATPPETPHANDELLTMREVADVVRVPVATLRYWRYLGTGPRSFRIGRSVRYWRTEVATLAGEPVQQCTGQPLRLATVGDERDDESASRKGTGMAGNLAKRPNGKWRARCSDDAGIGAFAALRPQGRRPAVAR
jgi:predicted DNA-binding transcriptional regulator AlpA